MKRYLSYFLSVLILIVFFSCQKETSFENSSEPAQGSLVNDVTGECLPKTVSGTYIASKALNDTNYIEVQINVTEPGSYNITTDTTNGYSFKGTGTFTATGLTTVRLKGAGTPAAAGTDLFAISFDTTFCLIQIVVLPAGSGGPASFTLQGTGGNCVDATVNGSYVKGTALTGSNTVNLKVNVTSIGTYSITTAATNGMTFSGAGNLTATGTQSITLTGSGTPVNDGAIVITVSAGSSSCTFTVTVTATAPPPLAGDYFPLSANSWWSYEDPDSFFGTTGDSLTRLNINPITISGNSYRIFQEQDETTPFDSAFYRKNGNDYLEITIADLYSIHSFDATTVGEILFLKENLTTGQTWQSAEYTGTESGIALKLRYAFTCSDANATVSINGKTFNNVYKISWKPQYSLAGTPYADDVIQYETYFAKGIGMIFFKGTIGSNSSSISIKNWKVL